MNHPHDGVAYVEDQSIARNETPKRPDPIRKQVLHIAEQIICRDRQDQHGKPENTFDIIAELWEAYLYGRTGHRVVIQPVDVAQMMVLLKVARFTQNPKNLDNFLDGIGYEALAAELAKVESR